MKKKWGRTAMRFVSARYVGREEMLHVTFENGDHFLVAAESLAPGDAQLKRSGSRTANRAALLAPPDWSNMRISETGDVLEVPNGDAVIEIPWDRIRSLADPEFRAYLADHAAERAQRIGKRIGAMRRQAGMSRVALADKVCVAREVIANLEAGILEPQADLIADIATALGRRLRDLAAE
jgi:DNA-binding XRE family transcriptional regulator